MRSGCQAGASTAFRSSSLVPAQPYPYPGILIIVVFAPITQTSNHIGTFFSTSATLFFSRPRVFFARSRLRGTQGDRVYSRRKFGLRPCSVARTLGVQGRAIWQVITGSVSATPEPRTTMKNPHDEQVFACSLLCITSRT